MAAPAQEQQHFEATTPPSPWERLWGLAGFESTPVGQIRLHTVSVMRWVAVVGQLFTILFVHFSLDIELPLIGLLPAVAITAAINLGLLVSYGSKARLSEGTAAMLFAYDLLQLCWLLLLTGGLQNPFSILLVLPVTLAAATLSFGPTILLTGTALIGAACLALVPWPLPWRPAGVTLPSLYLLGGWTALSMAIILIAIFTWNIAEEARRHAEALAATQLALAREQKLSALGGQAAAAAHLLGSPLGTINIIAKELVRELPADSGLREEAHELLGQAQRCGQILAEFGRNPEPEGEDSYASAPLSSLLESIADEFGRPEIDVAVEVDPQGGAGEPELVPTPELRHALANLIDNAIQFAEAEVVLSVLPGADQVVLVIEDDGPGFSPDILDWLGEPYISTRRGQGGMGLGVFIAKTLLARTGAGLHFDNGVKGARVTITWPRSALARLHEEEADGGRDR
jgi:two-component system, sensor histidine kinase RegB